MHIRAMNSGDIDSIVSIIANHEAWDEPYARAYYEGYFERIGDDAMERNFVAEVDGAVVGVCGFGPPKFPAEDVLWGTWFYVHEDHRGSGLGRELGQTTLDAVRELGARKVYLDTSSTPIYATAVKFYKSLGFQIEGTLSEFYDEEDDLIIMGLTLSERS